MKINIKKNLKLFKDMFVLMDKTGRETNMIFTTEGLSMICTSANVTATKVEIAKDFFDVYEINGEKEEYAIVIKEICGVIKKLANNEITLDGNKDTLTIIGDGTRYVAPLLNKAETLESMPEITFEHTLTTTQNALLAGVGKMVLLKNESVKLFVENKKLIMKSAAQVRKVETEICDAPDIVAEVFISKKLLGDSLIPSNDDITLSIGNDLPLMFNIKLDGLKIRTVIAPRVAENY